MIAQQQNEGGGFSNGSGGDAQMLKKGPWTAAEDAILADYVRTHGEGNWNAVQKNTGLNRCGKSCRLRWANHLRPNLKKGFFTSEEERLIVELHAKLGNKWARMAGQMPGRTDNEIKNYWNTRVKRRTRQCLPLYPSDIQPLDHHGQQTPFPCPSLSSAPSTSTCSFSFQTPYQLSSHSMSPVSHLYTTSNQFMHMPPLQSPNSPTPPHLHTPYESHFTSPMPIRSPSQSTNPSPLYNHNVASSIAPPHPAYPTLTFLNTATSPASLSSLNTNNTAASSNFLPRSPPSLQLPARIKRFRCDNGDNYGDFYSITNLSTGGTSMSSSINSSNMFSFSPLPKCSVLTSSVASTTTDVLSHSEFPSFPVDHTSFNTILASKVLCTHFDQGQIDSVPGLANQIKAEPPSSQILSQDHNSEIQYDNNIEEIIPDNRQHRLVVGANGMRALEDYLEETQVVQSSSDSFSVHDCSNMEDKKPISALPKSESGASIFMDHVSVSYPERESGEQFGISPEDLSKLLKGVPLSEWYNSNGEGSNGQSSVVTDDDLALELNGMASFLKGDTFCDNVVAPNSCSLDNLPRFC